MKLEGDGQKVSRGKITIWAHLGFQVSKPLTQRALTFSKKIIFINKFEMNLLQAYRREKQKAEEGISDPAETSWKLIKGLRERLQPGQVQSIVKKAGVIAQKQTNGMSSHESINTIIKIII